MPEDIKEFLERQRRLLVKEKNRLGVVQQQQINCDVETEQNNVFEDISDSGLSNSSHLIDTFRSNSSARFSPKDERCQSVPVLKGLDLCSQAKSVEKDKQAFVNKLISSESPLTFRSDDDSRAMLRCGEYSPNNPQYRVTAAPYAGLGEYEQRRLLYSKQRKADYVEHLAKKNDEIKSIVQSFRVEPSSKKRIVNRAAQTDIQNIHSPLVQYDLHSQEEPEKELCPEVVDGLGDMRRNRNIYTGHLDQRLTSAQNALMNREMEMPKSILTNRLESPRERHIADMQQHVYVPSFLDSWSYQEKADDLRRREHLKREAYQAELRMQIEEKKRLTALKEQQERREQDLGNRRLEQQLMRMEEEEYFEQRRGQRHHEQLRHNSEDFYGRRQEYQGRGSLRKHTESESSIINSRNTNVASKPFSHYSPPVSRRNPYSFNIPSSSVFSEPANRYDSSRYDTSSRRDVLNKLDSLSYDNSAYNNSLGRYDSLSRIDTLNRQDALSKRLEALSIKDSSARVQRRHSATQQDLSFKRSPKLQRRSSSGRFDDALPIPVLKAHSPVAKELKNSIAVNSSRTSSEALRRLEDKWQVPAVQRNFVNYGNSVQDSQSKGVLTQLGAIRMQLQQEQMRMDDILRRRGVPQSKAVDFH